MNELLKVIFEEGNNLNTWQMALRGIVVLFTMILFTKIGKRKFLGRNSILDIIMAVILGSVVSRSINGSTTLIPSLVTVFCLIICHWLLTYLAVKSKSFARFFEGEPYQIVKEGEADEEALKSSHFTHRDIMEAARLRGNVSDFSKIKEAYVELNGSISIIKKEE